MVGSVAAFAAFAAPKAPGSFPAPGEWPAHRRDESLQAHSPARGTFAAQPRIVWKQFVGKLETTFILEPAANDSRLALPDDERPGSAEFTRHGLQSAPVDANANATTRGPEPDQPTVAHADVSPDFPGPEKFEFESAFSKPTVNGQWQRCVGRCFGRRDGQWTKIWETIPVDLLFQPLPLVGDFDGDGLPEVAVLPMKELLLFDARTGQLKDRRQFTDTRSYGYFGAHDLDGDGRSEFLVQADFSKHIDVLGFRDGRLSLLWQRNIEADIADPQKILRVGPRPLADVDGDGRAEVLASVFNDAGDGRWVLTVHDALTGAVRATFPDQQLVATVDLDGDGASELLTIQAVGAGVPEFGVASVWSLKSGSPVRLWRQADTGWQMTDTALPHGVQSTATLGRRTVLHSSNGDVVLRRPGRHGGDRVSLSLVHWNGREFRTRFEVEGRQLEALAMDGAGRVRAVTRHHGRDEVQVRRGRAYDGGTRRLGVEPATVSIARPDRAGVARVVVQGAGEELVVVVPSSAEAHRPSVSHRIAGRGQASSWPQGFGPVATDLQGDGRRQLIWATASPVGAARLVAGDLNGAELWRHDFPDIPGGTPVWNLGGLIFWQSGHFTDARRRDVLVTVRRSMMHSEETALLSGVDGRQLWRRAREVSSRGVGGTPFAVADLDGDGLADAASFHPSIVYMLHGVTGRDLVAHDATWPGVPAQPVYWGMPIAGDFLGRGSASLFFAGRSMTGVVRRDGTLAWWDAMDHSPSGLPACGRFTTRGRHEVIGWGYPDGVRSYDTETGRILWRLPVPAEGVVAGCAAGDLDGDGRDEAVFAVGSKLVCIGVDTGEAGVVKWTLDFPAPLGPPSLGQLDSSDALSLLVAAQDGFIYCAQ